MIKAPRLPPTQVVASQYNWNLQRITEKTPFYGNQYRFPARRGEGVHIYVLDSGIRTTHEQFGGRAIPTLETVGGREVVCDPANTNCANDDNGHGTHCAGIAGGRTFGVASRAILHAVKVTDSQGNYRVRDAVSALDWVRRNAIRPAIISMSLGSSVVPFRTFSIDIAIHDAVDAGITVFVAAGNSGGVAEPGYDACTRTPAKEPYALTVGATDMKDARTVWSNWGRCVDIFAPGENINSAWHTSDFATNVESGTSQACPLAAGVGAVAISQGVMQKTVSTWILQNAISGPITNLRGGPNKLLYLPP